MVKNSKDAKKHSTERTEIPVPSATGTMDGGRGGRARTTPRTFGGCGAATAAARQLAICASAPHCRHFADAKSSRQLGHCFAAFALSDAVAGRNERLSV